MDNVATKIESILNQYAELTNQERATFISSLIGEHDLLKDMGIWFDQTTFVSLFKSEFEKGAREKVLMSLAEIDSNDKDKPDEIFWTCSPIKEQNTLFQQIMKSKDYNVRETDCVLDYDDPVCILHNNVQLGSQYALAVKFIPYEDAKNVGKIIKGSHGGNKVKVIGYLATL
jgi:hypothetical protein